MELCPLEGGGRSWQWRRLLGCCRNLVPRGRRLCSVRNRYADWVQAQPAAGEGAALFPVGAGEALRCLLLRTAEKALRCFPLRGDLTWCREVGSGALYVTDTRFGCRLSLPEKPPTGRFFWIVRIGSLLGGFSLTKAPSFAIRISDCKIHPQRRLTILVFRALRSSTSRRCPLDTCHLLKKVDENFYFFI